MLRIYTPNGIYYRESQAYERMKTLDYLCTIEMVLHRLSQGAPLSDKYIPNSLGFYERRMRVNGFVYAQYTPLRPDWFTPEERKYYKSIKLLA